MNDTIAAIATPRGEGGIAVLRVSGPKTEAILRALCPDLPLSLSPARLYLRKLRWQGEVGDEVLVTLFRAPRSYTGEDVGEIHAHGGAYNAQKILSWLLAAGARLAEPGEFTRRAFESGRIDLSQAQAVADLIAARSEGAHRLALRSLGGALKGAIEDLQDAVVRALAEIEAMLDFPEEDLEFLSGPLIAGALAKTRDRCRALAETYYTGRLLREGAEVVLVGRPNVGKSSLLNALAGEERAIVTAEAGTTRDPVRVDLEIRGVRVSLVDTAGIREVESEAERIGVERARSYLRDADLRLVLLDGSMPLTKEDYEILKEVGNLPHLILRTKIDQGVLWEEPSADVAISSKSGEGLDALREALSRVLTEGVDLSAEVVVSHVRHRDALLGAAEAIDQSLQGISRGVPLELVAEELYTSRARLAEITGREARDEILDEVFRRFCIGK